MDLTNIKLDAKKFTTKIIKFIESDSFRGLLKTARLSSISNPDVASRFKIPIPSSKYIFPIAGFLLLTCLPKPETVNEATFRPKIEMEIRGLGVGGVLFLWLSNACLTLSCGPPDCNLTIDASFREASASL